MVKHIVFWNVAGEGDEKTANIAEMKSKLESLTSKLDMIEEFEVGLDFNQSDAAFDVALYSSFATRADLDAYQVHPEHVAVANFVKSVATSRAVVDYEI